MTQEIKKKKSSEEDVILFTTSLSSIIVGLGLDLLTPQTEGVPYLGFFVCMWLFVFANLELYGPKLKEIIQKKRKS